MSKKLSSKRTILDNVGHVVSPDGEILTQENGNDYRITLEQFFEEKEQDKEEIFMGDVTFIKSFRGNGIMLNQKLTNAEIAAIVFLCDFVCYEDCVLRKNGQKLGNPLSIRDLSELIGIKYETFRKTMSSLKKKQVIGFHSTGDTHNGSAIKWITVNPYIFLRGTHVEDWVKDFYADSEWAKIERQKVKGKM